METFRIHQQESVPSASVAVSEMLKRSRLSVQKGFDYGGVVQKRVGVQLAVSTNNRWSRPTRITTDDQREAGLVIEANMCPKGDEGEWCLFA